MHFCPANNKPANYRLGAGLLVCTKLDLYAFIHKKNHVYYILSVQNNFVVENTLFEKIFKWGGACSISHSESYERFGERNKGRKSQEKK